MDHASLTQPDPPNPDMLHTNYTSRLHTRPSAVRDARADERQRIKEATRRLRTHAEKLAWHLADMASRGLAAPAAG